MKAIKLGHRVKDKVTEFTGIAVARCEYLNGCVQFHISPLVDEKGNKRKDLWVDEVQVEFIDNGILSETKPEPAKKKSEITPSYRPRRRSGGGNRSHPD